MTRRVWIAELSGFLLTAAQVPRTGLIPLDAAGFRSMVSAHRGKILVVDFWATWCATCREELPRLIALYLKYKEKGFDLITISCDEPEQEMGAAEWIARKAAPRPYYIRRVNSDDAFINAIDPKWSGALPALFLFDRSGHQVRSLIGETDMKQLESAVQKLLERGG